MAHWNDSDTGQNVFHPDPSKGWESVLELSIGT